MFQALSDGWPAANPLRSVTTFYASPYEGKATKALTAANADDPQQMAALLSTDLCTLVGEGVILPNVLCGAMLEAIQRQGAG
ncbi:hypothetical protein CEP88_07390 [Roseobacter denitrificans]|nr:hypothetical protein CEP88_07390 [Roseobacter denitrificans]